MKVEPTAKLFSVSFVPDDETGQKINIVFFPDDHEIHLGTTLIGRGASVISGRKGPPPEITELRNMSELLEGNDLAVKIYWPEERRDRKSTR